MALQNIFGLGTGQLPSQAGGSIEVTADADPPSGWALRATNATTFAQLTPIATLASSTAAVIVGGWFYIPTGVSVESCISVDTGSDKLRLDTNTAGVFSFRSVSNDAGTFLALNYGTIPEIRDEWFHLAYHYSLSDTTGVAKIYVNGNDTGFSVLSGDTLSSGAGGVTRSLKMRGVGVLAHSIYAGDDTGAAPYNDILAGTPRVDAQTVDGSGTSDWVGSDADSTDNHLLVDEAPAAAADTTDYIESSTSTDRQIFDAAASGITGDVHAVKVTAWGRDTDAGGQQVDLGIISNATESTTPSSLAASDGEISTFFAQDPDGPAAWDQAARDAIDVVLEVV